MVAPSRRKGWPPVSGSARRLLLLMALLAYTMAAAGDGSPSACDTAKCGKGNCTALGPPAIFPNFECDCDPGWSRAFKDFPFSPCIIPNCSFHGACLNNSVTPPKTSPTPDICLVVNCGPGGACRKVGDGPLDFRFSCDCQPGYVNLLNDTVLPCMQNCLFGTECSPLGLSPPPESPAPPSPAPPPSGDNNHDSSGPSAPPTGTKGSVSSRILLQLLLLISVAMVQLV